MSDAPKIDTLPFIPMPPLDVAVLASKELSKGKTLDEICETVNAAVEADPTLADGKPLVSRDAPSIPQPSNDELPDAETVEYLQRRYLQAYLRLATGRVEGLAIEEMDDIAQVAVMPGVSFQTWLDKKGFGK